jgi:serine/threonine-protein kinase
MPLESGQSLSHYRLVEKIGEGGMGVVWKAVDTNLDREVAIKLLPDGLAADPHRLERFQREAKLLASLSHARIASLYGLHRVAAAGATSSDIRFLSMELVEGEDLDQRLERGPLALDQALPVALQIAEGLEAAHESGVIHRDLKPANIKLTAQGDVKILDFGLAKALHDPISGGPQELSQSPTMTAAATQAGVILGTAAYMSPEQSRGQETDRRTDVWALGCVLYEMLTGRGTFHAATASDCIARILEREPDWEALPADTPPAVRRLVRRCLEKDPRRRWHDVADVRIELEDLLAGVGSDPTPAASRSAPRVSIGLGVAAGLLVGVLLTAWWLSGRNAPAGPLGDGGRTPERFSIALPDESPAIPKPGTMAVAVSPDGRRIAYVGLEPGRSGARTISGVGAVETGTSGRTLLYLRDIDDYEIRPIEGTAGAASPFFSPDGEWIGFIDPLEARLKKIRVDGGVPVTVCDAPNRAGHWGADGRIYFSGVSDGIFAVSENGGVPEVLSQPQPERGEKTRRFPHVLPGGRGVLFTLGTTKMESYDEAGVALLDPETGEHRMLLEGGMKPSYLPTGHILYGRGGALYAIPFDLETLEVSGAPFLVADEVVTSDGWGEAQYAVSGTGTLVYVPGGPEIYKFTVYWLDRDGRAEALPLPSRDYASALFSPDGKRLAISSLGANATIWVYENERRTMLRLTTEWDHYAVIWTRAGGHVTTASGRAGQSGFWNLAADGSGTEELLLDTKGGGGYPGAWTLGDRALVFALANTGTGLDILTLNLDGKAGVTPLIQTSFQESNPKLSPDGRWLAYASDASGQTELYVQRYPEGGRRWPALWSPDGRELYYWKGGRMMAVSVDTDGSGFSPGEERALPQPAFSALLSWDLSPDGERFVVVGRLATVVTADGTTVTNASPNRVEVRVPEIRVVTDWFEELRKER